MSDPNRPLHLIRAARLRFQNPYAYIEDLEDAVELARTPLHLTENPWATPAVHDGDDERVPMTVGAVVQVPPIVAEKPAASISKVSFRALCSEIFMPYVPAHQPRKLAKHHRAFITRNENRPGTERRELVEALRPYDLSTTAGVRPHFNRELPEDISDHKLRQIEASIGKK